MQVPRLSAYPELKSLDLTDEQRSQVAQAISRRLELERQKFGVRVMVHRVYKQDGEVVRRENIERWVMNGKIKCTYKNEVDYFCKETVNLTSRGDIQSETAHWDGNKKPKAYKNAKF